MDPLTIAAALAVVLLLQKPAERKAMETAETKEPEEPEKISVKEPLTISVDKLPVRLTPGTKEALEKSLEDRKNAVIDYGKQTTMFSRGSQATERAKTFISDKKTRINEIVEESGTNVDEIAPFIATLTQIFKGFQAGYWNKKGKPTPRNIEIGSLITTLRDVRAAAIGTDYLKTLQKNFRRKAGIGLQLKDLATRADIVGGDSHLGAINELEDGMSWFLRIPKTPIEIMPEMTGTTSFPYAKQQMTFILPAEYQPANEFVASVILAYPWKTPVQFRGKNRYKITYTKDHIFLANEILQKSKRTKRRLPKWTKEPELQKLAAQFKTEFISNQV